MVDVKKTSSNLYIVVARKLQIEGCYEKEGHYPKKKYLFLPYICIRLFNLFNPKI